MAIIQCLLRHIAYNTLLFYPKVAVIIDHTPPRCQTPALRHRSASMWAIDALWGLFF